MRKPKVTSKRVLGAVLATALTLAGTVALANTSEASTGKLTASPASGPAATAGKVVTLTGTGFKSGNTVKVDTIAHHGVSFQTATCGATAPTPDGTTVLDATARSVPSSTKIVATVPSLPASVSGAAVKWNVCVYDTSATPGALLSAGAYSTVAAPVIDAAISPVSGTVAGGDVVTISGSHFGKAPVVKFGTVASPTVVVAKDGLSLTAVAPLHAAGAIAVSVTAEGGTNPTPASASWDDFTYVNAVSVSPTTAPNAAATDVTVNGVGFSALNFASSATSAVGNAKVYLVKGTYDATVSSGVKTNAETATCGSPVVVSDTEISCSVPSGVANGAYTVTVVNDGRIYNSGGAYSSTVTTAAPVSTVVSSSATFTVADF